MADGEGLCVSVDRNVRFDDTLDVGFRLLHPTELIVVQTEFSFVNIELESRASERERDLY